MAAKRIAKKTVADVLVREEPAKTPAEPRTEGKTIDERMAALLEDHKRMGSR